MTKDYYSILGIDRDASQAEVKAAYRKLALKFHPDKNPGDPFFEQMFRDLKYAYETLSDVNKRAQYDARSQSQKATNETRKTRTELKAPSPAELTKKIISNLRQIIDQTKGASTKRVKTEIISDYLNKTLVGDIINLYEFISDDQKRNLIFSVIPLLRFFGQNQINKYAIQLAMIAGSDNQLIEEIDKKIKSERSRQKVKNTISSLARNWKEIGVVIFIASLFLYVLTQDAKNGSDSFSSSLPARKAVVDDEPEAKSAPDNHELVGDKKPSKWIGNHLETGESPYNHYFGEGIYDKNYENRVKIHNGQENDVIVCLTQYNFPHRTIRNEYIRAGESFEMTSIPNGMYYLKSFFGNDWNPDTLFMGKVRGFFEKRAGFSKSDNYSDLLKIEQDNYQYSIYEITLYPVVGGNMESESIDVDEFFK